MYKSDEEWTKLEKHLKEIYFSNRWSYYGGGKFHTLFESMAYEKLFDKKMAPLLVSNGTMAIELAIRGAFHNKSHYVKLGIPALTVPMVKFAAERSGHVCLTLIEDREEREQYLKAFIRLWKEVNR